MILWQARDHSQIKHFVLGSQVKEGVRQGLRNDRIFFNNAKAERICNVCQTKIYIICGCFRTSSTDHREQ